MHKHTNLPIEIKPKLIRDRIPELIFKNEGVKALTKTLTPSEFRTALIDKLHEETEELALAMKDNTNIEEELADLLELLKATSEMIHSNIGKIEKMRVKKEKIRGSFKKRLMLLGKATS